MIQRILPKLVAVLLVCCSISSHAHGLSEERLHTLTLAITAAPNDPELYVKRGRVYRDSEQWNFALANYEKAINIDPHYYQALYWQGDALLGKQDYARAITKLLAYLYRVPQSPAGHRTLAEVYIQSDDLVKAAEQFDQAIAVDNDPPPQLYLERVHNLMNIRPLPIARIRNGLSQGLQHYPNHVVLIKLLMEAELAANNYAAALDAIDQLPQKLLSTPQWLNQKAEIELLRGQPAEAIKYYRESLARIEALPKTKQALPAFVDAKYTAEMELAKTKAIDTTHNHTDEFTEGNK